MAQEILNGLFVIVGILLMLIGVGEMDYHIDRLPIPNIFKKILSMFGILTILAGIYYGLPYLGL